MILIILIILILIVFNLTNYINIILPCNINKKKTSIPSVKVIDNINTEKIVVVSPEINNINKNQLNILLRKTSIEKFNIINKNKLIYNNVDNYFNNEKVHLISYGNGKFKNQKKNLFEDAIKTNWFYSINIYDKDDLDDDFKKKFSDILSYNLGGGYWIWKIPLILKRLREIKYGEFLIYLDAGCSINIEGKKRFIEYINSINNNKYKIISFELNFNEYQYTIEEIFNIFNVSNNDNIKNTKQYMASLLIMKKCNEVVNLFEDCLNKIYIDPLIITDHYNKNQLNKNFIVNRHDQSILSVARKIHGSIIISDETWYKDFSSEDAKKIPFLTTRIQK